MTMTPEEQIDYWLEHGGSCGLGNLCSVDKCIYKKYLTENRKGGCKVAELFVWAKKQKQSRDHGGICTSIW